MYKNKFFADGNSSSSEENSDDEQQIRVQTTGPDVFYVSYNTHSNNEDDIKRVVRSKKEKCYEEIKEVIKQIKQAICIRDINRVYEYFENLIKIYDKARRVIEKEQKIPRFYIKILIQLDTFINQCWNDRNSCNKLNKINLNTLRQKFRRYINQQPFQNEINEDLSIDESDSNDENDEPTCNQRSSVEQEPVRVTLLNEEEILKKLDEIISRRGKREVNYQNQLECLNMLRQHVQEQNLGVEIIIKILSIQITVSLDYQAWIHALNYIEELSENLNLNSSSCDISDDLIGLILQMDEEYTKILQKTDPHNQDYTDRLKDEIRICSILNRFKLYFELNNQSQHLCSIYLCIIEHTYYKYNKSSIKLINHLCKYIYTNDTLNHVRARASLCHIYYLALHDYYNEARDLMLMCHIQDTIQSSDISTQILYNRTIVQLGLCAFRFGVINEAHQALVDIQSGNRIKELLGQDNHMMHIPYHMHINLQLIECIYLISAMLIEIPSRQKHLISKQFHILMYQAEKQTILGPPESMREHIVAAMIKMLINKIKEESLRIYLFTYATSFSVISMLTLTEIFELPIKQVYGIISKMIINKELMGSIEESDQIVLMNKTNSSRIQGLSIELMGKISRLYEQNEKLSYFYFLK